MATFLCLATANLNLIFSGYTFRINLIFDFVFYIPCIQRIFKNAFVGLYMVCIGTDIKGDWQEGSFEAVTQQGKSFCFHFQL